MSSPTGPENRMADLPRTASNGGDGAPAASAARSVPDLLRELSNEAQDLVRQEIALARAEMNEKLDIYKNASLTLAVGGAFLLAALFVLVLAVNHALTALLAQAMELEIAVWLAPLILAAVLAGVGWGMFKGGKQRIADEGITPHETRASLEADRHWAKKKVHEVKEGMRNG